MQYQGGKHNLKRDIGKLIMYHWREGMNYYEPFVGGASILDAVRWLPCQKFASDISPDLIALWKAVQAGWEPPGTVTEEEYHYWKAQTEPSAMRGFVGYGCSFAGKFFGGYAKPHKEVRTKSRVETVKNSIIGKRQSFDNVVFYLSSYNSIDIPPGSLVYCDPPYAGTAGYKAGNFNHDAFWDWVRLHSKQSVLLISEFNAPGDFQAIMSLPRTMNNHKSEGSYQVNDQVFIWKG